MKNITRHTGKLNILQRLPNSYYGNPRFLVRVDGWTCKTTLDSAYSYAIENYNGKNVIATIGTHYGSAALDSIKLA
jgi:hypothetical protein